MDESSDTTEPSNSLADAETTEEPHFNRSTSRKRHAEEQIDREESRKAAKNQSNAPILSPDEVRPLVSYALKGGRVRKKDGKIEGATLHVNGTNSFTVSLGEAIMLLKNASPEATEPTPHPAMAVAFSSLDEGRNFAIRVRWLITARELRELPDDFEWKGLAKEEVLRGMGEYDVVLSPQVDDVPVQTIVSKASVKLHWRYDDDNSPKKPMSLSSDAPPGTYTCQYQLMFLDGALHLDYVRLGTANDLEGTASRMNISSARGSHSSIESGSFHPAAESSDEDAGSDDERRVVAEGEGSNLRTSISIGSAFQATVPPFQPKASAISRRPAKAIWKPGKISEDTLSQYLQAAAKVLNSYLRKNDLTSNEPYTPVSMEMAEKVMKENPDEGLLTGSSLSTASGLTAGKRNPLLKECDIDQLLEHLFKCDGNISKAMDQIEEDPTRFICAWAPFEKEMFSDVFRLHHGAIRKIAKSLAPFKTVQEVVDYQYRFKIPDQFRLFHERKREIAMRIVECIDNRRVVDPSMEIRRKPLGSYSHWSETNPVDLVRSTEQRREKARQLMLDVNAILGKSMTGQIANAVKELNRSDAPAARTELFKLLHGHTDLQRRFNEFLPKPQL